jgi:hypothetical protein
LDIVTNITGTNLDCHYVRSLHSHEMTLTFGSPHAQEEDSNSKNDNPKTDFVVPVVNIVPIAIRRTTIVIVVVPRATTKDAMDLHLL